MKFLGLGAIALLSLVQFCPAPIPLPFIASLCGGIVSGSISGAIGAGVAKSSSGHKRSTDATSYPPGVSQQSVDLCKAQLRNATVYLSGTREAIRAEGVPPACMDLATVLLGTPVSGPVPTPLSASSVQYTNLTDDEINQLADALEARGIPKAN